MPGLLAAEIWHWWIGVILTVVGVLAVLGLIGQYVKTASSTRYPNRRQRQDD